MKTKLLISALVMSLAAQNAMAVVKGAGRDGKGTGEGRVETRVEAKEAAKRALVTHSDPAAILRTIHTERIGNLSPSELRNLQSVLATNESARHEVADMLNANHGAELSALDAARIKATANLNGMPSSATGAALAAMSPLARAEQAFATLAIKVGKKAESFTPETRENVTFLLTRANEHIALGKSRGEAMQLAAKDLEQSKSVRLDIDKIKELCE